MASELQVNTITEATSGSGITFAKDVIPATPLSHRNMIINGGFDVWQRATTFSSMSSTAYTADRWQVYASGSSTVTVTRQTFSAGQTDVAGNPKYYLRIDNTPDPGNSWMEIFQRIEDVTYFSGVTVTLSFYVKASTNITNNNKFQFAQNFGSGGSTTVSTNSANFDITTSWAKKELTVSLPSISGKTVGTSSFLEVHLLQDSGGSIGADTQIDFAQFQLELGSVATPFEHRSYGEELQRCQRYYQTYAGTNYIWAPISGNGAYVVCDYLLSVEMRATPTASNVSTGWTLSPTNNTVQGATGNTSYAYPPGFNLLAEL